MVLSESVEEALLPIMHTNRRMVLSLPLAPIPGKRLLRVHGALVTEAEVKAVSRHVKDQGEPDYSIMQAIEAAEV